MAMIMFCEKTTNILKELKWNSGALTYGIQTAVHELVHAMGFGDGDFQMVGRRIAFLDKHSNVLEERHEYGVKG